jgi:ribosomal protein S18 acetylase RimI-like enzyme
LRDPYLLIPKAPSVDDYCRLRTETGLGLKTEAAAKRGLAGTLFGVSIHFDGEVVGMGRVVGDGGLFYQIVDIGVLPAHRGKGLGKRILKSLIDYLVENAPESAYVSLLADGEAHRLYRQFGFAPTAPRSIGMFRRF